MNYSIIYDGDSYELPQYKANIADKIERIKATLKSKSSEKDRCKLMYDFNSDMIGKDNIENIIGPFMEADFNVINIIYENILDAYSNPLREYKAEKTSEVLKGLRIDEISKLSNLLQSLEKNK